MKTIESMFKEARCTCCNKVLPVERVHLFRSVETPSMIDSLTFCSKDCDIDFNMKGVADLAKAFLLSMNELDEDSMRVIERKFQIARQKANSEVKSARTIKCGRCGHAWMTTSKHKMVSCPSCLGKTHNMHGESVTVNRSR
jgi:phage FluMu protein Com